MQRLSFLMIIICCCFCHVNAQNDSCKLRFSLLTCSPGQELYSFFGHSALRLIDSTQGLDIVFNYGTFDFNDPGFYTKFGRGNMQYFVSVEETNSFKEQYSYEKRNITEQLLNLNCIEKEKLNTFLKNNIKEENKYYLYNFLFDNCSSRLKDIVTVNSQAPLQFKNTLPAPGTTFRNLIHEYLDKAQKPWTKMGLDFLLGANLDKKITNEQAFFLPEYLMRGFDSATINQRRIVNCRQLILQTDPAPPSSGLPHPVILFSVVLLIMVLLSCIKNKRATYLVNTLDFLLFFLVGLTGLLLAALWLLRTDTVCRSNYNLLWALPTHTVMAFFVFKKEGTLVKRYWLITTTLLLLLLLLWSLLIPQQINFAVLPLSVTLLIRSFIRYKKIRV